MFSDGFESVGPIFGNQEQVSREISELTKRLHLALKEQDWQLSINQLETIPPLDRLSLSERSLISQSLIDFRAVVERRHKQALTFPSESLADLSEEINNLLTAKEREFGL